MKKLLLSLALISVFQISILDAACSAPGLHYMITLLDKEEPSASQICSAFREDLMMPSQNKKFESLFYACRKLREEEACRKLREEERAKGNSTAAKRIRTAAEDNVLAAAVQITNQELGLPKNYTQVRIFIRSGIINRLQSQES